MNIASRREKVMRLLRRRNRFQFGQPIATSYLVLNSGCTDACIQLIVWMAKDKRVSLNDVRRRSGAGSNRAMLTSQALRALASYGLSYQVRNDIGAREVVNIARTRGPVIVCERYWAHPQWLGYFYAGRTLHGLSRNAHGRTVRVGAAKPVQRSGLSQWTYRDGHAVLVATDMTVDGHQYAVVRDPNHNSATRPERPAFDLITLRQLRRMLESYRQHYGYRVVLVPTHVIIR